MIVELDPVTTKNFFRDIEMTLCSSRKLFLNTMSNSSILKITKLVCLVQVPILIRVLFAIPGVGRTGELMIFICLVS